MSCDPEDPCTCDDDLCLARARVVAEQDAAAVYDGETMMIRSADGQVHTVPIETRQGPELILPARVYEPDPRPTWLERLRAGRQR